MGADTTQAGAGQTRVSSQQTRIVAANTPDAAPRQQIAGVTPVIAVAPGVKPQAE